MVSLRDHGGSCCGVRHIYGFDSSTETDFDELMRRVENMGNVGSDRAYRMIEVILSDRQVDKFPWLERKGFRLVSRFENANSGRFCNVFHYHPHFLALNDGAAANWNGARHSTGGNATPAPAVTARPLADPAFRPGDRIRYALNGGAESRRGLLGTLREVAGGGWRLNWDDGQHPNHIYSERFFERAMTPAPVAVLDVLTFYQNVFVGERMGGQYPTLEAARAAAPRCRRVDRIVYRSDGTSNRTIGVN